MIRRKLVRQVRVLPVRVDSTAVAELPHRPIFRGGRAMIAPAHPLVRYRVATDAEPSNFMPALASLLIAQWREKHQTAELAAGEQTQAQPDNPSDDE